MCKVDGVTCLMSLVHHCLFRSCVDWASKKSIAVATTLLRGWTEPGPCSSHRKSDMKGRMPGRLSIGDGPMKTCGEVENA